MPGRGNDTPARGLCSEFALPHAFSFGRGESVAIMLLLLPLVVAWRNPVGMWLIGSVGTAILMMAPFETTVALDIAIIFSFAASAFAALAIFSALAAFAVFIATAFA